MSWWYDTHEMPLHSTCLLHSCQEWPGVSICMARLKDSQSVCLSDDHEHVQGAVESASNIYSPSIHPSIHQSIHQSIQLFHLPDVHAAAGICDTNIAACYCDGDKYSWYEACGHCEPHTYQIAYHTKSLWQPHGSAMAPKLKTYSKCMPAEMAAQEALGSELMCILYCAAKPEALAAAE